MDFDVIYCNVLQVSWHSRFMAQRQKGNMVQCLLVGKKLFLTSALSINAIHLELEHSHQIPSQNKTKSKLQILKNCQKFKFCKKIYTWNTYWSCLIRCINIKWIQPELYALQSGHGMRDGRSETNIPPNFVVHKLEHGLVITYHSFLCDAITHSLPFH